MVSDSNQFVVPLLGPDGFYQMSTVVATETDNDDCRIEMTWENVRLEAVAGDFFEAFCKIRIELWKNQLLPDCYGAHLRAFPSGMSRSMGGGFKLYRLTLGKQALTKDLVQLFDAGQDVIPATVEDQRRFFDDGIMSLGK